ncbi:MAG: (Fe-S)-binding protein [Acidobacteriota bacterium]
MVVKEELLKKTQAYYCLDCGKCTSVCPISRFNGGFSPRRILIGSLTGRYEETLKDEKLYTCLTCGLCGTRCPSDVKFGEFIKNSRFEGQKLGNLIPCSHGGAIQSLMRIMTSPSLEQRRLDWVTRGAQVAEKGEVAYFIGCLPYFDAFFTDLEVDSLKIAKAAVKILNRADVEPVLLKNERCCGHDLLWAGDLDNFKKLAEHNINAIKESGAKTLITTCAECYRTFKIDYPTYIGPLPFKVLHITEFLIDSVSQAKLNFKKTRKKVTFQDPCRLGRHLGMYEQPRMVLSSIPALSLVEMERNQQSAICCGTSGWMNCDAISKRIQSYRLKSAQQTGADSLVTGCPKCYIHFKCAMKDPKMGKELEIEIKDLTSIMADALGR